MDSWKHSEILTMLEGGNKQLQGFFERHMLTTSNRDTYRTNAAKFYKRNLALHVLKVGKSGVYEGRETYRKAPSSNCQHDLHPGHSNRSAITNRQEAVAH